MILSSNRIRFFLAVVLFTAAPAFAIDFTRESAPRKWFEPLVPEDLPPLQFPKYFTDFDKAKAEAFAGRYKLALQTLRGVKGVDPVAVALIKGNALSALGRFGDALAALSEPAVVDQAKGQVGRARI